MTKTESEMRAELREAIRRAEAVARGRGYVLNPKVAEARLA